MSTTRRKGTRVVATAAPTPRAHGRLAKLTPAVRVSVDVADARERFAVAVIDRAIARQLGQAKQLHAAGRRVDRARTALMAQPGGLEESRCIVQALASCGGAVLRAVQRSHVEVREYSVRAALRFLGVQREHRIQSTAALTTLASGAQWSALGEMLRERALAMAPGDAGLADVLRIAERASSAARLDTLTALQLEKQARDTRGDDGVIDAAELARRVAELQQPAAASSPADAPTPADEAGAGDDAARHDEGSQEQHEGIGDEPAPYEPPPVHHVPPRAGEQPLPQPGTAGWLWHSGRWVRPDEPDAYARAQAAQAPKAPAAPAPRCEHGSNPQACVACFHASNAASPKAKARRANEVQ